MPFVCSLNQKVDSFKQSESVINQPNSTDMSKNLISRMVRSLQNLSYPGRDYLSRRTSGAEKEVVCLQGKASAPSVQCENIQIMIKTCLYP